jgi:hypothetical protein
MRVKGWDPTVLSELVEQAMPGRVEEAARVLANAIRSRTPVGTTTRPMYRRGPYAGQFWTARDGGELRRSVRVVKGNKLRAGKTQGVLVWRIGDFRVYIGHAKAYYVHIVEHYTPFIRPTFDAMLSHLKIILGAR